MLFLFPIHQVLHMMLFGCHPFLFPADMELSQGEQIMKVGSQGESKGGLSAGQVGVISRP